MPDLHETLAKRIAQYRPATLLAVGSEAIRVVSASTDQQVDITACEEMAVLPEGHWDLAVVCDLSAQWPSKDLFRLTATLRDRLASTVLLTVRAHPAPGGYLPVDFFAYGMRLAARLEGESGPVMILEFSLSTYKPAPEWLNSKYWANPERFDADF